MVRLLSIFALLLAPAFALAQMGPASPSQTPAAMSGEASSLQIDPPNATIEEKLGEYVPADARFTDETGRKVALGDYLNKGRPIILQLGYFNCPMLCDVINAEMVESLKAVKLDVGSEYVVLSVSIDPNEDWQKAYDQKNQYLRDLGTPGEAIGWHLLTGSSESIAALTDSVGFRYEWVEEVKEWAHPAALIILAPDGKVTRYIYGVEYPPETIRLSLIEAADGQIGTIVDRIILTCFRFNHATGKYQLVAWRALQIAAGITVVVMAAVTLPVWIRSIRESRRRRAGATPALS
jgi:protein SCO1/2